MSVVVVMCVKFRTEKVVVGALEAYSEGVAVVPCAARVVHPACTNAAWVVLVQPWLRHSVLVK